MKKMKVFSYLALGLGVAQILLMLTSWLLTAAMPENYNRSLLSSEGIRWFFGQFQNHIASPVLVWLVLGGIAYGAFCRSGIVHYKPDEYRQRFAMGVASFELGVFVIIMLALTLLPHAILLNVMGGLFPSSFTQSIIPYTAFAVTVVCCSFGVISDNLKGVEDIFCCMSYGISKVSPLIVLYVFAAQLFYSVLYLI